MFQSFESVPTLSTCFHILLYVSFAQSRQLCRVNLAAHRPGHQNLWEAMIGSNVS